MKSDRFIPSSNYKNKHVFSLKQNKGKAEGDQKLTKLYRALVMDEQQKQNDENQRQFESLKIINDKDNEQSYQYLLKLGIDLKKINLGPTIINKPDRILQALSLSDNFYLNLLDCSSQAVLAVGLSRGIYLWKPSGSICRIRQAPDIAAIKWNPHCPELIACGTKTGSVEIWDAQKNACICDFYYHQSRVGSISWFQNPNCFLSGGKDSQILSYDLRTFRKTGKYKFHDQQVCSLRVQPQEHISGTQNFASGSNDKNLVIWNTRMKSPMLIYKHSAAIKGMAWHPSKSGVLASGGGTEDRSIKIWNTTSNQLVKTVDTGSQVCNLMYIKNGQDLVSSHGFNRFETNIWDSSSMTKKQTLIGHSKRVLYLSAQPDGQTIITGAGDQTIRFWKLKESNKKNQDTQIKDRIMTIR